MASAISGFAFALLILLVIDSMPIDWLKMAGGALVALTMVMLALQVLGLV